MNRFRRFTASVLPLLMVLIMAGQSHAVLQAVGPTDPQTTLPTWYQDSTDMALQLCLDQNGFCVLTPDFDPAGAALRVPPQPVGTPPVPISFPISDATFPDESFYFIVDAIIPNIGGPGSQESANLRMALEAAFLTGVTPNQGITFLRVNLQQIRGALPANTTYTVTYPFGSFQFTTDNNGDATAQGGAAFRSEDPVAPSPGIYFPPEMHGGTLTHIGPFLKRAAGLIFDPTSGHTYIGDAVTPVPVTGGTNGNIFRITGANIGGPGVNSVETNLFTLAGRVFTGAIARPLTIDRATYARDASGGQVDIFVTSLSGATLTVSGSGLTTTVMTPSTTDSTKYFAHIPFSGSTLPSALNINNNQDINGPIAHPVTLVDEVNITEARYNPADQKVTIRVTSRDTVAPLPTFTAVSLPAPNAIDNTGRLTKLLTTIPPAMITVQSSIGGSETIPLSVVIPPPPPVAADDSAVTVKNSAVTVNVLANDTAAGGIDPATVIVAASPASGATAIANANGTVTYTPTSTFTGSETFTYNYKDFFTQTSNTATVTVTVHAPPVAVNDTASAVISTTVNIDVIANDTAFSSSINSTTVNIVSAATCGSTVILPNGTVNFTAPATIPTGPGTCIFSYVVTDTFVPATISNVATVTVTITPPPAPVAVNDTASTTHGIPVVINVIGNDTSQVSTINPATLAINATTGGTAAANLDGTVTYTPPATSGTYTFTYTVMDNAVPALVSNTATVTVTVTAPAPATGTTFTPNVSSPQPIGTLVLFTAQGQGGTGSYEYEFWRHNGTSWSKVQAYSSTNSWLWNTATTATGPYTLQVNVRSTGSAAAFEASGSMFYTVDPAPVSPVANNDLVTIPSGSPVFINVISNDASSTSTINPATLALTAPTGGSASANLNGTVTYTPPVAPGTYTFTYTVKDNATPSLTSNAATVTVTVTPPPPVTSATLTALPAAPQTVGSSIAVLATATGGSGNYEYEFLLHNGVSWSTKQAYSSKSTWTWDTTGLNPALCTIEVHVRNTGSTAPYEAIKAIMYQLVAASTAPAVTTGATLTVVPGGPKLPGSAVVFAAGGTGGSGTYEYEFWLHNGVSWSKVQSYSAANTFGWDTTGLSPANYTIEVHVRSAGSTAAYEAIKAINYQLVIAATGATLDPSQNSPVARGVSVDFTATGIGGSGSYEYTFWRHDGTSWTNVRPFSTNPVWTWDTTGATQTTYTIEVHVRSAGSSSTSEAYKGIFYTVQ